MRITMHRGVVGEDATDWLPGEQHDASESFGHYLVSHGFASLASGAIPAAPPLTTAGVVESRDPKPRGRR